MAANNYYNFTHGGTQYGAHFTPTTGTPGYTAQAYGQPPVPGQGYAPAAAEPYVIPGYTRPTGQQPAPAVQQTTSYYAQQPSAAAYGGSIPVAKPPPQNPRPQAPSTAYPAYSANTSGTTSSASYAGFSAPQPTNTNSNKGFSSFTNYDAAVYNAVTAYAQGGSNNNRGNAGIGFKNKNQKGVKGSRPIPKPQTLHYCDVCKISCAGPQTYKEHLEGQKHKKKEQAQKAGTQTAPKGGPVGLRCELCDVTCTGSDAYAAHIRGAKHQKVLKLHTKLGKPIPSDNPTVVSSSATGNQNSANSKPVNKSANISKGISASLSGAANNVSQFNKSTPKTSFLGSKADNSVTDSSKDTFFHQSTTFATPLAPGANITNSATSNSSVDSNKSLPAEYIEKDVQPVGQDYIEEIRNDEGKIISFNCKLCECKFNDPNAKEMHMKGRRHRLQYKKKVNPELVVDVKPSSRQKKLEERRIPRPLGMRKIGMSDPFSRGPVPLIPPGGPGPRGYGPGFGGPSPYYIPPLIRRTESVEDRHVMAKHSEIYPQEEELQAIQKIVSNTEKALKFVSDKFAEEDCLVIKPDPGSTSEKPQDGELQAARKLKGVMRVGHLAKGLLLRGDRCVQLVVLCSEKPTISMLHRVFENLPKQLKAVASDESYEVRKDVANAGLVVSSTSEPKIDVQVVLTSPLLRGTSEAPGEAQATQVTDPIDALDKEKCLDALAALRHAKWFQARATTLQSCVIIIRILRDLAQRNPVFQSLSCWAMELLAEKAINSAGMPISPGDALRIVLEVLSTGLLLPSGPGLLDPCEKESSDALQGMTNQMREDITVFAQQALRQVAFRQIHLVLGMEPLPRFNKKSAFNTRKRRRDASGNMEGDDMDTFNDGKKDKKEESMEMDKVDAKMEQAM